MKLKQVKREDYPRLSNIIQRHIDRCDCSDRTTPAYGIAQATLANISNTGHFWTDDIDNPSCYLLVTTTRRMIIEENACIIHCMFLDDENDPAAAKKVLSMLKTAESFAKQNDCDCIYGSSWVFKGGKNVQGIWEKFGAEEQEILNVKFLK